MKNIFLGLLILSFTACSKLRPSYPVANPADFYPRPQGPIISYPPYGTPYLPDSVFVNSLLYKNINWEINPANYDAVLALDISARTTSFILDSVSVYLDKSPINGLSGLHHVPDTVAKTIHIHMPDFDGWALSPFNSVTVEVFFK